MYENCRDNQYFPINLDPEVRNNDSITKIWLCKVMSKKMGWQVTKSPPLNPPLLLIDVFEKFIDTCLKYYELDPCHNVSSPGLSWDTTLKMTDIKLEKISDIDKYLFIEKGLRGGISYIAKRYAKVNNKYMNDYDPKIQWTFISYLDMNNLYGSAISEYLPYEGFKWLKNVDELDVMLINEKNPIGYL